jgi:hypothetical protein
MKKHLKGFSIYVVGYLIFSVCMYYAFGIDASGDWAKSLWLGGLYFIANLAGDIESRVRHGDRA